MIAQMSNPYSVDPSATAIYPLLLATMIIGFGYAIMRIWDTRKNPEPLHWVEGLFIFLFAPCGLILLCVWFLVYKHYKRKKENAKSSD